MAAAEIEIDEHDEVEAPNAWTIKLFDALRDAAAAAAQSGEAREATCGASGSEGDLSPLASKVRQLLREGADSRYQDPADGVSALMLAAQSGDVYAVNELLLDGAPWNAVDRRGLSAGDHAIRASHQGVIDRLVSAGVQAELLFRALAEANGIAPVEQGASVFLTTSVRYEGGDLLDADNRGVMMEWERPIMEAHAAKLCQSCGDVLNIGFGLGIIDSAIQTHRPRSHTIIEAHPVVHARMLADGWDKKPGVTIHFGRWQDVVPTLGSFDAVFFDTFDDIGGMEEFHAHVGALVRPGGLYSYFNGVCPESLFFQGVACELITMQLAEAGFDVSYEQMDVPKVTDEETWRNTKFRYYLSSSYFCPVAIKMHM